MTNPFVYGEIVPAAAFVDREVELDRLGRDLYAGQKVFLISPRRYGKSSLVRQALKSAARSGALTVEVQVSSYSSYVAFLEGYARALASAETRLERARVRGCARCSPASGRRSGSSRTTPDAARSRCRSPPSGPTRHLAPRPGGLRPPRADRRSPAAPHGHRARRVPGHRRLQRRQRRARAARRRAAAASGRLRVLRIRTGADGADAGQEPAVLQGRPGHAPAEDPGRSLRRRSSKRASRRPANKPAPGLGVAIVELAGNCPTMCSVSRTRCGTMSGRARRRSGTSTICTRR